MTLTRETGFHARTSALTRRFDDYHGYWTPRDFDAHGAVEEYWATRERAGIMDLSALRKVEVLGPDAEDLLQYCVTRDVRRLSDGRVVYTALCNDTGAMIDDATVFRLAETNFRVVCGDEYTGDWLREQAARRGFERVWVRPSTDQLHNLAVQGPASRDVLTGLVRTAPERVPVEDLTWFRFTVGRLDGGDGVPVLVSRTGYSGELGYELWCHPDDAPAVWDAVWEAGRPHGLVPVGLEAVEMLRIEAGLAFAGHEFDGRTDPFEAGVGFTVALDTTGEDFVGRAALEQRRAHPQQALVGLQLDGSEPAASGDGVHVGRWAVGVVTSAIRSPLLGASIALARLAVEHVELGTAVEIGKLDGHRKRIPARVVRFPFYDPDKVRPRS